MVQNEPAQRRDVEKDYAATAKALRSASTLESAVGDLAERGVSLDAAKELVGEVAGTRSGVNLRLGRDKMWRGALSCAIGLMLTMSSYLFVGPGGSYVVTTGAILWGGLQFVQGLSMVGRAGLRLAVALVAAGALVVSLPFGIVRAMDEVWRTYTDTRFGFSVQYPALWRSDVREESGEYIVEFSPKYGRTAGDRLVRVGVLPTPELAGWTFNQCQMWLKDWVLSAPGGRVLERQLRTVVGFPGAQVGFEMASSGADAYVGWSAMHSTADGAVWLEAISYADLARVKGLFARFVSSYHPVAVGDVLLPPDEVVDCPTGYDPYRGDLADLAVCYPSEWLVAEYPDEQGGDGVDVFFSPALGDLSDGLIAVAVEGGSKYSGLLTDDLLIKRMLTTIAGQGGKIIRQPVVTTIAGRRAVAATWQIDYAPDGVIREGTKRESWLYDGDLVWTVAVLAPSAGFEPFARQYESFLATLQLLTAPQATDSRLHETEFRPETVNALPEQVFARAAALRPARMLTLEESCSHLSSLVPKVTAATPAFASPPPHPRARGRA